MTYTEADIIEGRKWRHLVRGSIYTTLRLARHSTNGEHDGKWDVVYVEPDGTWSTRLASEFLDGRFRPITPGRSPQ